MAVVEARQVEQAQDEPSVLMGILRESYAKHGPNINDVMAFARAKVKRSRAATDEAIDKGIRYGLGEMPSQVRKELASGDRAAYAAEHMANQRDRSNVIALRWESQYKHPFLLLPFGNKLFGEMKYADLVKHESDLAAQERGVAKRRSVIHDLAAAAKKYPKKDLGKLHDEDSSGKLSLLLDDAQKRWTETATGE